MSKARMQQIKTRRRGIKEKDDKLTPVATIYGISDCPEHKTLVVYSLSQLASEIEDLAHDKQ